MEMFRNDLLVIYQESDIFKFTALCDKYENSKVEEIKNFFENLFTLFDSQEYKIYGCIFDLSVLSSWSMFNFAKQFKNFFHKHEKDLHKYFVCTSIVTNNTMIRVIIGSIVKLVNKGRPFSFNKNIEQSQYFISNELSKIKNIQSN